MMDSLEAIESQRELALENDARGELRSLVFWAIPALIDKIRRTEAALADTVKAHNDVFNLWEQASGEAAVAEARVRELEAEVSKGKETILALRLVRDQLKNAEPIERAAAVRAERERCLAVVRWVRALYPETAFPPDSDSRDAISGTWARKVCDNIVAQIEEAE